MKSFDEVEIDLSQFYYLSFDPDKKNDALDMSLKGNRTFMKLLILSRNNEKITININDFTEGCLGTYDLQRKINAWFDPITIREILKAGCYGSVGTAKIYVSKKIPAGYFELGEL